MDASAPIVVAGWAIDTVAQGWAGFDDVQVFNGPMDQNGVRLAQSAVGLSRPDVAVALNNPYWEASGFTTAIPAGTLKPGSTNLFVYAHAPMRSGSDVEDHVSIVDLEAT